MELWSPPHDAPHLLEWWRPLMLLSRRARAERFPWPVHLDEFRLAGRVKRQGRPDVWIYDHHDNGGSVCVDAAGQTYKFMATPNAKGPGQFRPCPLRTALWRARLPDVVEPVRYERPGGGAWGHGTGAGMQAPDRPDAPGVIDRPADVEPARGDVATDGSAPRPERCRVVRRRHLTLIAG